MSVNVISDKITEYKNYAKQLLELSLPIILGNVGNMLIGVGDVIVAGRHSTVTLAAISCFKPSGDENPLQKPVSGNNSIFPSYRPYILCFGTAYDFNRSIYGACGEFVVLRC